MKTELPDFDVLLSMARNRPDELETLRHDLVRSVIDRCASHEGRRRLEGLQFRVDMERERARTPLAACIKVSEMMCRSMADLHRSIVAPETLDAPPRHEASILPLPVTKRSEV